MLYDQKCYELYTTFNLSLYLKISCLYCTNPAICSSTILMLLPRWATLPQTHTGSVYGF